MFVYVYLYPSIVGNSSVAILSHNVHLVSLLGTAKYKMVQKVFAYVYL